MASAKRRRRDASATPRALLFPQLPCSAARPARRHRIPFRLSFTGGSAAGRAARSAAGGCDRSGAGGPGSAGRTARSPRGTPGPPHGARTHRRHGTPPAAPAGDGVGGTQPLRGDPPCWGHRRRRAPRPLPSRRGPPRPLTAEPRRSATRPQLGPGARPAPPARRSAGTAGRHVSAAPADPPPAAPFAHSIPRTQPQSARRRRPRSGRGEGWPRP